MKTLLACALTTTMALAACGGGDDSEPAAGEAAKKETQAEKAPEPKQPPTKAEYIAAGDEICTERRGRARKLVQRSNKLQIEANQAGSYAVTKANFNKSADLAAQQLRLRTITGKKLKALEPPEEGAADAFLASRDRTGAIQKRAIAATRRYANKPSAETVAALEKVSKQLTKSSERDLRLAKRYGFKVCSKPLVTPKG